MASIYGFQYAEVMQRVLTALHAEKHTQQAFTTFGLIWKSSSLSRILQLNVDYNRERDNK